MENKKKEKKNSRGKELWRKSAGILLRWFYLVAILFSAGYSVYIWKKYIVNADWTDEKKKEYISEQSVLPFDEGAYQKAIDLMKSRESKLESADKYSGRDIFFPD